MTEAEGEEFRQLARLQYREIEKLRAQLAALQAENRRLQNWIMGDEPDALTALQRVYSDPQSDTGSVIKSASAALPFERSKPASVTVLRDWKEYTYSMRMKGLERDKARWAAEDAAKFIEAKPLDLTAETPPTILGGDDSAA